MSQTGAATRKRTRTSVAAPDQAPVPSTSSDNTGELSGPKRRKSTAEKVPVASSTSETTATAVPSIASVVEEELTPKFETKRIIIGTLQCKPSSHVAVQKDGIMLHIENDAGEKADILLQFAAILEYMVCDSANLPVIVIRGNSTFGDSVRLALPSLKKTDNQDLSCHIFDPFSPDKCHWYVIAEMMSASVLCDLIARLMQNNITSSSATGRLMVPKSILAEEAKKKINATHTITLKWRELQLGSWKSQTSSDRTVHISGSRIKFKAKCESGEVTLALHLNEVNSLSICSAQVCPVMFIRASESFGWSARDRLGISSTFKQGKDYYNPDSPETRFKYITFRLEKQGLSRDLWQQVVDISGDRYFMIDPISSKTAVELIHKLTYHPITCSSIRVGANELDEIRAVTIHFDSICICGCMLDSVVTMNICIADVKELYICLDDKMPVLLVKTSVSISDTLKNNMGRRSTDVFFDPNSKDIRTQYIVVELESGTNKTKLKKINNILQTVLTQFNDRSVALKETRANHVRVLTKKRCQDMLAKIKKPLPQKECTCGKKEDKKLKEEVKQYVQSMTQKHGCEALEKIATRAVELERKVLCSVCLDKDCQIAFSCGHLICERCDQSLRKCHICRTKILRKVKIFI